MSDKSEPMMTNVKGYFNPNPYRVNVSISELGGMSVQLGPMEFIMERHTNRKINDPLLDKYVGYKMLSPELSNTPVPVVMIPKMQAPQPSMHVVTQGVRGADGKWQAGDPHQAPEQSMVKVPPTVSKPSVTAMSIDEARRRGFVGKAKLVDENYGAAETDGAPTRGDAIPRIKYAMESQAPLARPGQLPQELQEQVDPKMAPLIAGLQAAAQADPEAVSLGRRAAEAAVAEQQGKEGVQKFRAAVKQIKGKPKAPTAVIPPPAAAPTAAPTPTIQTVAPRRRVAQVVSAAPVVQVPEPMPVAPESPLVGGHPGDLPPPVLDEAVEAPAPEPPPTAADRAEGSMPIKCAACGKEFPYMSYYKRHVLRAHKDRMVELMPAQHP
jgi:hypothetical protein